MKTLEQHMKRIFGYTIVKTSKIEEFILSVDNKIDLREEVIIRLENELADLNTQYLDAKLMCDILRDDLSRASVRENELIRKLSLAIEALKRYEEKPSPVKSKKQTKQTKKTIKTKKTK
jgi:hypothetical protein